MIKLYLQCKAKEQHKRGKLFFTIHLRRGDNGCEKFYYICWEERLQVLMKGPQFLYINTIQIPNNDCCHISSGNYSSLFDPLTKRHNNWLSCINLCTFSTIFHFITSWGNLCLKFVTFETENGSALDYEGKMILTWTR